MGNFSWKKIRWIKNIKRNKGNDWAYSDVKDRAVFPLNWPTKKKGSALIPKVGDIIVLFQKPNFVEGVSNKFVHLTHLVTPISEEVYEDETVPDHRWYREVKLIAMANPIHAIPNPGYYNFFKPNRGLTNPIRNLEDNKGFTEEELKKDIWKLFENHLCEFIEENLQEVLLEDECYIEGETIIKEHMILETKLRNSQIVKNAKEEAKRKNNGTIICECCKFSFFHKYGQLGKDFIECHHKNPICQGERLTYMNDLIMVCSNCHRMLHRKKEDGTYHDVQSLKNILK